MSDWDTLFGDLYLRTYALLDEEAESEREALAAVRLAGCNPGADVLDCPCGYGRHSIPLARAGYRVVGADRSQPPLDEARRRAGDAEWPRLVQADYRKLPFEDASFDAVLNLFTSIGMWGEKGDRQALAEFRRVLRPGGRLVLDTVNRDRLVADFRPRDWNDLPGGAVVVEERCFDPIEGVVEAAHVLVDANGSRESFGYRLRVYTATELGRLAREAGFEELAFYGDLEGAPLSAETRLVLVAR